MDNIEKFLRIDTEWNFCRTISDYLQVRQPMGRKWEIVSRFSDMSLSFANISPTRLWCLGCVAVCLNCLENQYILYCTITKTKCFDLKSWEVRDRLMMLGGATFDFDKQQLCSSPSSPSPPEAVVINNLYTKTAALVCAEQLLTQLTCCIYPSYRQFLSIPCFVHRVDSEDPIFIDGTSVPSFLYTVVYRSTAKPLSMGSGRLHGKINRGAKNLWTLSTGSGCVSS